MLDIVGSPARPPAEARPLRVLMVEDNPDDAALVQRALGRSGLAFQAVVVDTFEAFGNQIDAFQPDVVLADYNLPGWTGLDALRELQARNLLIPFLLVTGTQTDEVAAECMRMGADDYLLKHSLSRLPSTLNNVLKRREAERERAEAQSRLRQLQDRYRLIAEHTGDLICILDVEGRFLYASPSYLPVLGFRPDELLGTVVFQRVASEDRERARRQLLDSRPDVTVEFGVRVQHRDGSWRDIEGTGRRVPAEDGQPDAVVLVSRDASERRRFVRAVEEASREWRATFDAIGDAVSLISLDRKVLRGNRAASRLAGLSPEAMIGQKCCDLISCSIPADRCPSLRMRASGRRETETVRVGERWFTIAVDPRTDSDGNLVGGVHIVTDVTREKVDEMRLLESFTNMRRALDGVIRSMGYLVESRDPYTAGHQHRVARLARSIAIEMGLDSDAVAGVYAAAEIHDIGKIAVPSEILVRPGRLTPVEFDLIKTHVVMGADILRSIEFPWPVADMVRQHHERQDGTGYPAGLKGEQILVGARILAVSDVVEAMASHRPYRPALGIDQAIAEVVAGRGTRYDAGVVDACLIVLRDPKALDGD